MTTLLKTQEAADFLGIKTSTLETWRSLRKGPPFVKIGPRMVRYPLNKLEAWIFTNEKTSE